ncbi:hypothetical protein D3C72_2408240 [compost metagenome]
MVSTLAEIVGLATNAGDQIDCGFSFEVVPPLARCKRPFEAGNGIAIIPIIDPYPPRVIAVIYQQHRELLAQLFLNAWLHDELPDQMRAQ